VSHLLTRKPFLTVAAAVSAVACSLAVDPTAARAQSLIEEVKLGVLHHDTSGLWSGFRLEQSGVDINAELLFRPALAVLAGSIRPVLGGSVNTAGNTSHGYLGLRWQAELPGNFYLGIGLGGAVHDGHLTPDSPTRKALGSRVLFHIPAEIGYRLDAHHSLSLYFEHTSNAWLASYNEGMDRIGMRYGYRF
jgi:lipid A 3-O-deacylase